MKDRTGEYAEQIAKFVEGFPDMKRTDFDAAMSPAETPADAMIHAAKAVPPLERDAVVRLLPRIHTDDFAEAANEIRWAARRAMLLEVLEAHPGVEFCASELQEHTDRQVDEKFVLRALTKNRDQNPGHPIKGVQIRDYFKPGGSLKNPAFWYSSRPDST